jgi:tetratricopeptide (TPR) repeat protein
MTASTCSRHRLTASGAAIALAALLLTLAAAPVQQAAAQQQEEKEGEEGEAPKAEYSKEFRKIAGPVQEAVNAKKWDEVLAALPELEAIPEPTRDDKKAIATWRLQATQATGDQDAFVAAIETFLSEGFAEPENVGPLHRQAAAIYSNKQDREKTLFHFQKFVDATPDVQPDEYETLGRLQLQGGKPQEGAASLGKAIESAEAANQKPKEMWFQLRDRAYIEMKDDTGRLNNLETLVKHYPSKEYYSRIVAIYQGMSQDDRTVMLNAYRLAVSDPQGGLETVGGYINYAGTAMDAGSPGEAVRALERGMKEGIVPNAGTNQQTLNEAKAAVARDKKSLPGEAAEAAKGAEGEVDVKLGLGFFSTGDFQQAATVIRRGIEEGGVERPDDANLLLGAALMELGRRDEARAAFEAASAAAAEGSPMKRIANLWLARATRSETETPPAEPAPSAG